MPGKKKGGTAATVWKLAQPLAEQLGLRVWDVRFVKEGAQQYLRVYIDKPGGVGIDDCVDMSHALDAPLDALQVPGAYTLEVSSPGINRELTRPEHFAQMCGQELWVRFIRPFPDGAREIIGTLVSYADGQVTMENAAGEQLCFATGDAAWIKLADNDFDETGEEEGT